MRLEKRLAKMFNPLLNGVNIPHSTDFIIDRPRDPFGTCLVFSFRSPGLILTVDGMKEAEPGDCIIHSVDFHQFHSSVPGASSGYRNDFLHAPPMAVKPLMDRFGLAFNRLVSTAQPEILAEGIKNIQLELLSPDGLSGDMLMNILEKMFLNIARASNAFQTRANFGSKAERRYLKAFFTLRDEIRLESAKPHTIKEMAAKLWLSPERFAVLYKKFFGKSPYNEILEARLLDAKRLLASSSLDAQEIAAACGWQDAHYFSRIFRKKIGVSPAIYRCRSKRAQQTS